jgi:predicted site-specific integrase-resolvase
MNNLPDFIRFDEAAEVAGVSRLTIKRWVREKKIAARYPKQNVGEVNVESLFKHVMPGAVSAK